jgi:hypothetical protein
MFFSTSYSAKEFEVANSLLLLFLNQAPSELGHAIKSAEREDESGASSALLKAVDDVAEDITNNTGVKLSNNGTGDYDDLGGLRDSGHNTRAAIINGILRIRLSNKAKVSAVSYVQTSNFPVLQLKYVSKIGELSRCYTISILLSCLTTLLSLIYLSLIATKVSSY